MEVAAAWAEVRVGVKKSDSIKSIYIILEVAAALAEVRAGVKRSDSTKSVYMILEGGTDGSGRLALFEAVFGWRMICLWEELRLPLLEKKKSYFDNN